MMASGRCRNVEPILTHILSSLIRGWLLHGFWVVGSELVLVHGRVIIFHLEDHRFFTFWFGRLRLICFCILWGVGKSWLSSWVTLVNFLIKTLIIAELVLDRNVLFSGQLSIWLHSIYIHWWSLFLLYVLPYVILNRVFSFFWDPINGSLPGDHRILPRHRHCLFPRHIIT
jgi:hypothetical protein